MSKLIVIDWGNIIHRAIFSFRNNSQVPFTYTILRMVIGYLKRIRATLEDRVLCVEDFGPSWRRDFEPLYKSQRKAFRESKEDADWWAEVYKEVDEFTRKLDQCLPWNFCRAFKIEADDWASVAVRYLEADEKILISSDEDWQQLCIIPNVKIFSPYTKKFKIVNSPQKILLKKLKQDVSDNLLEIPKTEAEWEKRRMIVDLISLPQHIEQVIVPVIQSLPIKNLYLNKVPYRTCREGIKKLYKLE